MNEPLPGSKTSILAGLYVLVQAVQAFGFVSQDETAVLNQVIAVGMSITLALKARRASKGK